MPISRCCMCRSGRRRPDRARPGNTAADEAPRPTPNPKRPAASPPSTPGGQPAPPQTKTGRPESPGALTSLEPARRMPACGGQCAPVTMRPRQHARASTRGHIRQVTPALPAAADRASGTTRISGCLAAVFAVGGLAVAVRWLASTSAARRPGRLSRRPGGQSRPSARLCRGRSSWARATASSGVGARCRG